MFSISLKKWLNFEQDNIKYVNTYWCVIIDSVYFKNLLTIKQDFRSIFNSKLSVFDFIIISVIVICLPKVYRKRLFLFFVKSTKPTFLELQSLKKY